MVGTETTVPGRQHEYVVYPRESTRGQFQSPLASAVSRVLERLRPSRERDRAGSKLPPSDVPRTMSRLYADDVAHKRLPTEKR